MRTRTGFLLTGLGWVPLQPLRAAPAQVRFAQSVETVAAFDFVEVTLAVAQPDASNPFTDAAVTGEFSCDVAAPLKVDGFCDATDGSMFRGLMDDIRLHGSPLDGTGALT